LKKLLLLLPSLNNGGMERVAATLSQEFRKHYQLFVVSLYPSENEFQIQGEIYYIAYPLQRTYFHKCYYTALRQVSYRKIKSIILPDITLSFGELANFISLQSGGIDLKFVTVHSIKSIENSHDGLRGKLADHFMKILYPKAAGVICVSEASREDLIEHYQLRCPIQVINNPCNVQYIRMQSEPGRDAPRLKPGVFHLMSMGRLIPLKGFHHSIRVMRKLEDSYPGKFQLHIIGEGPELSRLENLVHRFNLHDAVFFYGKMQNPFSLMAAGNLYLLTSEVEGFPMVLVESLALDVPVIATECSSVIREILGLASQDLHNDCGIIIPKFEQNEDDFEPLTPTESFLLTKIHDIYNGQTVLARTCSRNISRFDIGQIALQYRNAFSMMEN